MQSVTIKLTLLSLALALAVLGSGCAEVEATTSVDELAERVAEQAQLDDWEMCRLDGDPEIDAPDCEAPPELSGPDAAAGQLAAPEIEPDDQTCLIGCGGGCCFFYDIDDTDPHSHVTVCCQTSHGPECNAF